MSQIKPVLEPAVRTLVEAAGRPASPHGPDRGREAADVTELVVSGGPSGEVALRIFTPEGSAGPLPVILYIPGTGAKLGVTHSHDRLIREVTVRAEAATVVVDYSQLPEAAYPVAIEEIYAALLWLAEHGDEQGLDGSRIAVAGDSAGGGMAAAVTLMAKHRGGPALAGQLLLCPVTDAAFDTDSYEQFADGYVLTRDAMRDFWDRYAADPAERVRITAAPLRATVEELAGLPEALVVMAEADVLRDEGEAYAAKLRAAGVPSTAVRYDGVIHGFMVIDELRATPAALAATRQACDFLHEVLHP